MKKRLLIPIVIALTLLVTLSAMVMAVSATSGTPELNIVAANLSFEENVHLLYVVDYKNIDNPTEIKLLVFRGKDVTAEACTLENAKATLIPTDTVDEDGVRGLVYEYSALVAAEMTEDVYVRAYVENGTETVYSPVVKYSILQYACNKLGVTGTATEDTKLAKMLQKMLEYGAAAQEVFEVNLDRLATDDYVKVSFDGATLKDGLSYGLFKVGEKVEVYAPTDETNKYALWTDANGNAVGNGGKIEYTATKNANVTAETMDYEPSFGAYDRVIIIGVDGAGSFYPQNVNENSLRIQNKIFGNGAVTRTMRVGTPTSSCISWGEILHGVEVENHGVVENYMCEHSDMSDPGWSFDSRYPSILKLAKDANPDSDVAALYSWIGIHGLVEQNYGIDTFRASDVDLTNYIVNNYLENNDPKMLYVHLQNVDYVGHTAGHHTEAYYEAIDQAYVQIEQIYDKLAAKGMLENTLFIVTTDHGGIKKTHGGLTDSEKYGMFAASGKTVVNSSVDGAIGDMYIRDGATIALYALGLAQPDTYTSAMPANFFNKVEATARKEYHDPDSPRYHLPEQTPAKDSDGYVTNFVNNDLLAYIPFDGSTTDLLGREVKEFGKTFYEDGYFGQGINLDDGYLNIMDFAPGKDSFTLAFWMKTPSPHGTSPILMNKEWHTGDQGIYMAIERDTINPVYFRWGVGSGITAANTDTPMPEDFYAGWMHIIITVDRAYNEMRLSVDFGEEIVNKLESEWDKNMRNVDFTSIYNYLVLGNDVTGELWERKCGLSIDEFMYFDGAFTRNDINDLCEYYGREHVVPDEKKVTDVFAEDKQPDVYFDFNGNTINQGTADLDVSVVGTIPYVEGADGQAAYFDGKNYLSIDNFDLGAGSYTFSFWLQPMDMVTSDAKVDTSGSIRYCVPIMSNSNGISRSNAGISIELNCQHDMIVVVMGDGSGNGVNASYDLPADDYQGKWTHVIVRTERSANGGTIQVFVNFSEARIKESWGNKLVYYNTDNVPFLSSLNTDNPFNIGQFGNPEMNSNTDRTLLANIDDLMIFKRALTDAELKAIREFYTNPLEDYLTKAPVINMGFDGNLENNGTYDGEIVDGGVKYSIGKLGTGATFTGSGVELADLKLDSTDAFAFSFWINTNSLSYGDDGYYVLNLFSTQTDKRESLGFSIKYSREYNVFQVCTGGNDANPNNAESAYVGGYFEGIMEANKWMHVVIIVRRAPDTSVGEHYVEFYFDGERGSIRPGFDYNSHLFAQYAFDAPGRTAHIGTNGLGTGTAFTKFIDDFMFFDSALTAEEIAALGQYYAQFK